MSKIPFRLRTLAMLLFTLLLGLNAIAVEPPALTGIVIEVPTPPTPIPAQGRHHFLCELHITNLRSNSLELDRVEFLSAHSSEPVATFDAAYKWLARFEQSGPEALAVTFDPPDLDKWIKRHIPMSNKCLIEGQPAIA